jgi:hypothetical protein
MFGRLLAGSLFDAGSIVAATELFAGLDAELSRCVQPERAKTASIRTTPLIPTVHRLFAMTIDSEGTTGAAGTRFGAIAKAQ